MVASRDAPAPERVPPAGGPPPSAVPGPGRRWRVLQFPVTRIALDAAAVVAFTGALERAAPRLGLAYGSGPALVFGVLLCAGVLALYAALVRLVERRDPVELHSRGAARLLGLGALGGAGLFGATMAVLWAIGAWRLDGRGAAGPGAVAAAVVSALTAGCVEEVLMRGVLFRIVEEYLGSWIALGASALFFGLAHVFNPGAGVVSTLAIALEAGVLLAAAFMWTRRLWAVIGLHAAWNFVEGGVFGASVSGYAAPGILAGRFRGGAVLTGGAFGPEASLVAVAWCLAAGATLAWLARRDGLVVRPVWRRG